MRNMINKNKWLAFYFGLIMLNFVAGCSANDVIGESACEVNTFSELDLPTLVVVGTDVVNIESFQSNEGRLGNNYSTEIGGAILTLSIISDSKNTNIKRTFQEPGEPIHTSLYELICISKGTLRAQNLIGKVVNDGILLLEKKPNVDGIPVNLWVFYDKND